MNKTLIETCLESEDLRGYISHRAWKLSTRRKNTYDKEDAEQTLWEAILVGLQTYDESKDLIQFAKDRAYSCYGHIVGLNMHKAEDRFEFAFREDFHNVEAQHDVYSNIDTNLTLDIIESRLKQEANRGKQYRLALSSLKLRRVGYSQSETAELLGISYPYMRNIMKRVRPILADVGVA